MIKKRRQCLLIENVGVRIFLFSFLVLANRCSHVYLCRGDGNTMLDGVKSLVYLAVSWVTRRVPKATRNVHTHFKLIPFHLIYFIFDRHAFRLLKWSLVSFLDVFDIISRVYTAV